MKKETFIALALGIGLGIGIAIFLIFTAKEKAISQKKVIVPPVPTLTAFIPKEQSLVISAPTDATVTSKNSVVIQGKAEKNSLIVVESPTSEKVVKTANGTFTFNFPLSLGENVIRVTAYEGNITDDRTLKVYYFDQ
jgi:hypothetical protein